MRYVSDQSSQGSTTRSSHQIVVLREDFCGAAIAAHKGGSSRVTVLRVHMLSSNIDSITVAEAVTERTIVDYS
jgi:hypothetical protein